MKSLSLFNGPYSGRGRALVGTSLALSLMLGGCFGGAPHDKRRAPKPDQAVKAEITDYTQNKNVAVVLPLSGDFAQVSAQMRNAALLGLEADGGYRVDVLDLAKFKDVDALRQTLARHHDRIVIGPLLAQETVSLAPLANNGQFLVLSLASDGRVARSGEWVLGITPLQQARPLVDAAKNKGLTRLAAFLPDTPFGHALGEAYLTACQDAALPTPAVVYHAQNENAEDGLMRLAQEAAQNAAKTPNDAPQEQTAPPADEQGGGEQTEMPRTDAQAVQNNRPIQALLLGDSGSALDKIAELLPAFHLGADSVQILGPANWRQTDGRLGALAGAWYASAPDIRSSYARLYEEKYQTAPGRLSTVAFDAGILAHQTRENPDALTRAQGFQGLNGRFRLLPDGQVMRHLDVYEILPAGGARPINAGMNDNAAASAATPTTSAQEPAPQAQAAPDAAAQEAAQDFIGI